MFSENRTVHEIMWKNIVERGRPQMTIWRMRIACWVIKATTIHWQYVIFIALPLQQRLYERTSVLRCMYIACIVLFNNEQVSCRLSIFLSLSPFESNFRIMQHKFINKSKLSCLLNCSSFFSKWRLFKWYKNHSSYPTVNSHISTSIHVSTSL